MTLMSRRLRILLVAAGVGAMSGLTMGCGDEEPRGTGTERGDAEAQRPPSDPGGAAEGGDRADTADRAPERPPAVTGPDGSRTFTTEDGAPERILPPLPDETVVDPEQGCRGGGDEPPPPAPGLRASPGDGVVAFHYSVGAWSARCRPYQIRLTLYVSETGLSRTWNYPIRRSGRQDVGIPEYYDHEPDVARASIITRDARRSDVVSVLIR